MGRGRSSTNYSDAEKQHLLRAMAAVKPRRPSCWHLVAAHYNARRGTGDARVVERDAHSLKRKFKTMAAARAPRNAEFEDPYNARARALMARMKARIQAAANGQDVEEEEDDDQEEDGATDENNAAATQAHGTSHGAPSPSLAVQYPVRGIPSLAPLLPGPPPPPVAATQAPPRAAAAIATGAAGTRLSVNGATLPRGFGGDGSGSSDLAQLLLVIREENAQREAARRAEREEAIAREERWRDEARELRRQERDEAAAREDRYRREMAEQRRRDREEATARHEQMMVIFATLLKSPVPAAASSAEAGASGNTNASNAMARE